MILILIQYVRKYFFYTYQYCTVFSIIYNFIYLSILQCSLYGSTG